jgi:hypothetical protein
MKFGRVHNLLKTLSLEFSLHYHQSRKWTFFLELVNNLQTLSDPLIDF